MPGAYLMGWDAANSCWRKCLVNDEGKLIIDPSEILEDDPTDNEMGKAPTSNWAFDHKADEDAHHKKYTDAEAEAVADAKIADHAALPTVHQDAPSLIATHAALPSVHHIRYTGAEVRAAINDIIGADGKLDADLDADYFRIRNITNPALNQDVDTMSARNAAITAHAADADIHHTPYTDVYEVGTWTPDLRFGGAKVGITYTKQVGYYLRFAELVIFAFEIILSSKGTSVGAARIYETPGTSYQINMHFNIAFHANISISDWQCRVDQGTGIIILGYNNAGTYADVQNTDFNNNTQIIGTATFRGSLF